MKRRALFLDRDGTIVEHIDLLTRPDQLSLLDRASEGIALARAGGLTVVVVTNQPVVAHGGADESDVHKVHAALSAMLRASGSYIDAYYFCPHHPEGANDRYRVACICRKPEPGLFLRAARDMDIDLHASVMVGDRFTDVEAGHRAGCKSILLRSDLFSDPARGLPPELSPRPDFVCSNLFEAASWALERT